MFEDGTGPSEPESGRESIGAILAALAGEVAPGPEAVGVLAGVDPGSLTGGERVDLLKAWERQTAWISACQVGVLAALAASPPAGVAGADPSADDPDVVGEFTRHEVAAALRISDHVARSRLDVARALTTRLGDTHALLAGGGIGYWHALRVVEATTTLTDEQTTAVQARVLGRAPGQTTSELARSLRRAVLRADPDAVRHAQEKAAAERTVTMWPLAHGMAELQMIGPAAEVAAIYAALRGLADRPTRPDDHRPAPARRFDGLYEICADLLAGGRLPMRHGYHPNIQVTVHATTLLGLDDEPAELAGYGPITADVARQLAADGTWRRILTDPDTGALLDYGRSTYTPPADLTRHVVGRDRTCTFPHCTRPAERCDIDHAIPWDSGGHTNPENCGALCRRHHRAKTVGGWHLVRNDDHTCTWTSPTGHTYQTHPPPYGTDRE